MALEDAAFSRPLFKTWESSGLFRQDFSYCPTQTTLGKKEFSLDLCKWLLPRLAADLGNTDVLRVVSLSRGSLAIPSVALPPSLWMEFPLGADAACLPTFPPFVTHVQTQSPDRKGLLSSHTQSRTLTGLACHLWVDTQLRGAGQISRESWGAGTKYKQKRWLL